jgi:hypothetical protein
MRQKQVILYYYSLTVFQLTWAKMAGVDHDPRLPFRAGVLADVEEYLPTKRVAQSSSPSTT